MDIAFRKILRVLYRKRPAAKKSRKNGVSFSWWRFFLVLISVLVLIKFGLLFFYYNDFISLQYDVEEAAAQVDTQLQRRKNIILNLSVMVMGYAKHEKDIFKHTADTRKEMVEPRPRVPPKEAPPPKPGGKKQALRGGQAPEALGDLDALLSKIFAIAEHYPDLRLSENFQKYMDALVDAETKIAEQRMIYNKRANDMSTALGRFPGFAFARLYGFESPAFFEPEAEARKPPKVPY